MEGKELHCYTHQNATTATYVQDTKYDMTLRTVTLCNKAGARDALDAYTGLLG